MKKLFVIPAIICCEADSLEEADAMAGKYVSTHNGSTLLLDEELPTVQVTQTEGDELPHSILAMPEYKDLIEKIGWNEASDHCCGCLSPMN